MASIRRELILENLRTTAQGITVANGFGTDVRTVSRDLKPIEAMNRSEFPVIFIFGGPEAQVADTTDMDLADMEVRVEAWVLADKNLGTALNALIGDVFKAFRVDCSRGQQAGDTFMESIEDVDEVSLAGDGKAGALMVWRTPYHHTKDDLL